MEREKWAGESGKATRLKCDDIEGANSRLIFRLEKMGLETGLSPFGKPSTGHRNAQREFSMKSFSGLAAWSTDNPAIPGAISTRGRCLGALPNPDGSANATLGAPLVLVDCAAAGTAWKR
jgi:hypothetical protein